MKQGEKIENIVADGSDLVKTVGTKRIKVVVHIPEQMNEALMRRKINKIYDILHPGTTR